jgi:F-type H+-transporting ATPase subunit gamma
MQTPESLRRTITVTEELQSVVKTMKALAGVNIRQYERAAHAVAEYNHSIEMGLQIALQRLPARTTNRSPQGKLGAIVFGSDQGMCGQLNDQLVSHALRALGKLAFRHKDQKTAAVGVRAAGQLEAAGRVVESSVPVPSSSSGIGGALRKCLEKLKPGISPKVSNL